jgi:hypothetical protein
VETFARTVAPGLKFGGGPPEVRDYFIGLGEFFALRDRDLPIDPSLLARLEALEKRTDTFVERFIDES